MTQLGSCLGDSLRTHVREFASVPQVEIPKGRWLNLPRRGRTWLTELEGPPGAESIVLLDAVGCIGMLAWVPVVHELRSATTSRSSTSGGTVAASSRRTSRCTTAPTTWPR